MDTLEAKPQKEFLTFDSDENFEYEVARLNNLGSDQINTNFNNPNFVSMRSIYEKGLMNGEEIFSNPYVFIMENDGRININLHRYDISAVVNRDGIVQIGNVLVKYSSQEIMYLPYFGKELQYDAILKKFEDAKLDNSLEGVFISSIEEIELDITHKNGRTSFNGTCASGSTEAGHRIECRVKLYVTQIPEYSSFPCGSINCFLGDGGPTPGCDNEGQCTVLTDIDFRSTYEVSMNNTQSGQDEDANLSVISFWTQDGRGRSNTTRVDDNCLRKTLFSIRKETSAVNVTDALNYFSNDDYDFISCRIDFN